MDVSCSLLNAGGDSSSIVVTIIVIELVGGLFMLTYLMCLDRNQFWVLYQPVSSKNRSNH